MSNVFYTMFRVIKNTMSGPMESTTYNTLLDAYRACIPADESEACRLLINGVQNKISKGDTLIRVTCVHAISYWIQIIHETSDPFPLFDTKIECCHPH